MGIYKGSLGVLWGFRVRGAGLKAVRHQTSDQGSFGLERVLA